MAQLCVHKILKMAKLEERGMIGDLGVRKGKWV
jgi:hypothetical protein